MTTVQAMYGKSLLDSRVLFIRVVYQAPGIVLRGNVENPARGGYSYSAVLCADTEESDTTTPYNPNT